MARLSFGRTADLERPQISYLNDEDQADIKEQPMPNSGQKPDQSTTYRNVMQLLLDLILLLLFVLVTAH